MKKIKNRVFIRFFTGLICFALLYACAEEWYDKANDTQEGMQRGKNKEMTKNAAQQWYYDNNKPVSVLKSSSGDDNNEGLLVMPFWERAEEWKRDGFEVVETPMKVEFPMAMMDIETLNRINGGTDIPGVCNVASMVFLKNLKTGYIMNFIMVIVGSYEYMQTEGFMKNNYLHREPDLDGRVLFFYTTGGFINGWVYEKGKVTATLSAVDENIFIEEKSGDESLELGTKSENTTTCWIETLCTNRNVCPPSYVTYEWDSEFGWIPVVTAPNCYVVQDCNSYLRCESDNPGGGPGTGTGSGGPNDPNNPGTGFPGPGGVNPGGNNDGSEESNEKPVDKDNNCSKKSEQNAQDAADVLNNIDIRADMVALHMHAQTSQRIEFGVGISYDPGNRKYNLSGVTNGNYWRGTPGSNSVGLAVTRFTVFTVHTHFAGINAAPSCGDIIGTIKFYKDVKDMGGNYKGTAIFASNGSEYVIYVNNPAALENFYNGLPNNDFYQKGGVNGDEFKADSKWQKDYQSVFESLLANGYSRNTAQSYALSYIVDHYNMGLKIMKRQGRTPDFKEQKTNAEVNGKKVKYNLKICN